MTLTAAQAEIVRRFVAGDDDLIREYWKRERELDDILRAALIENEKEIERLGKERDTAYAQGARDATNVEGK